MLLPTEDLENTALRILLGDILADLILGNEAGGMACEGWFLWECITNLVKILTQPDAPDPASKVPEAHLETSTPKNQNIHTPSTPRLPVSAWFWSLIQFMYWTYVTVRFVVTGLFRAATTPPVRWSSPSASVSTSQVEYQFSKSSSNIPANGKRPILDYDLYGMLSQLLDVPKRMPWLGGLLALLQYLTLEGPGKIGHAGGVFDT